MPTTQDARRELRAELAWGAATLTLTCVLATIALKLWDASLDVPFDYTGDANLNQLFVKSVLDHGWYQHNPDLGAPFGQKLYDFPVVSGDNLQILLFRALGVFSSDSATVLNLFFLLTFPLTALLAFAAARMLGVSRAGSAAAATLFALLPYHFIRGEFHVLIGAYYAVPLGAYLAITAMRGDPFVPWERGADGRPRRLRLALLALACIVIGSAYVYYAAFTVMLLVAAALVRLVIGTREAAAAALAIAGLIGLVVVANHAPNIVYRAQHGANTALERPAAESEAYGLKVAAMVLPAEHHRLAPLARLRARYDTTAGDQVHEGQPQALGIVATAGLAGLLVMMLVAVADPVRRTRAGPLALPLAALTLAAILIGSVGGLSSVFAYLVTPQLRAWGRISVFVAFFALLAVVVAMDGLRARRGSATALAALGLIVLVGWLDQTNAGSAPAYAGVRAEYRSDAAFIAGIERALGAGASVFELPYEPFPEPQPQFLPVAGPYDLGRGYLHSHDLRWSYGLMKGRAGDWQAALVQLPPAQLARAVAAVGFTGIYLDRGAYADAGTTTLAALERETGAAVASSPDGRLGFLDLRGYAARIRAKPGAAALRSAVLRPVGVAFASGFSRLHQDASARYYLAQPKAELTLTNHGKAPRRVTVAMTLKPANGDATVDVAYPGGAKERIDVPAGGAPLRRELTLPPGRSGIVLSTEAPAQFTLPDVSQSYYLRVQDPVVMDKAFVPFGKLPQDRRAAAYLSPFGMI